jgi:purine-binding chemotaxis protein CheW
MRQSASHLVVTGDAKNRYLVFSLGTEEYAIPLLSIKEVIAVPETTPVPFTPVHFKGIINLRGQIISIVDLRSKFKMGSIEKTEETAVIIVQLESVCLGMIVDSVNRVLNLSHEDISSPPDLFETGLGASVTGVARKDSKLILLLDIAKTLNVEDLLAIKTSGDQNVA